jgi:type IV pilus assembly protein PilP
MMTQLNPIKCFVIPCLLVSLVACGEKASQEKPGAPVKPVPKKTEATKVITGEVEGTATNAEGPPPKYIYLAENRRDPFQPFLLIMRPVDSEADLSAQTPLQQYETLQYKLSAIIVGYNQPMAMVIAPDGKSYVVRKGMKIGKNSGTVVQINKEGFIVEEKYRDFTDVVRTNILEIKLPKREGV